MMRIKKRRQIADNLWKYLEDLIRAEGREVTIRTPEDRVHNMKVVEDAAILLDEFLDEQEPVEPKIVDTSNSKLYHNDMFKNHYCGNCGEFLHVVNRKDMFCSQCGRAVKWQ